MSTEPSDRRENPAPIDTATMRAAFVQAQAQIMNNGTFEPVVVISKPLALSLLDEIERLRDDVARVLTRCDAFAVDVVWRANWMTRAVNLVGDIRDVVQDEWPEHLAELEQLLTDEFEDGDGDD